MSQGKNFKISSMQPIDWKLLSRRDRFLLFPIIDMETCFRSEYWDAVAIMEYTDRAAFCRMVRQKCSNVSLVVLLSFDQNILCSRFWVKSGLLCWSTRLRDWVTHTPILHHLWPSCDIAGLSIVGLALWHYTHTHTHTHTLWQLQD